MPTPTKENNALLGLSAEELAEATKEYDEPTDLDRDTRELTPEEREWWERAQRGPGRPAKPEDEKVRRVLISIDPELLTRLDAETQRRNTSRSGLIAEAVEKMLGE